VTRVASVLPPNNYPVQYLGRLSDGRTPPFETELYVQQDIRIRGGSRFSLGLTVNNLFNQDTVTSKYLLETEQGAGLTSTRATTMPGSSTSSSCTSSRRC